MLLSPSGTGTTHLATAFGLIAPHKGWKVRFTSAADLAIALEGRVKEIMHRVIDMPKLLIIDDIGSLPFGREQATCSSRWWRGATEKGSMILTSNLTFGSWDEAFAGDAVLTAAMLDRMPSTMRASCRSAARAIGSRTSAAPASWRGRARRPAGSREAGIDHEHNSKRARALPFEEVPQRLQ